MIYPTISEYVEAIKGAEDNFELLRHLKPVLDAGGNPVMSSGNFAVVFKMRDADSGKLFALKCFTREQDGRNDAYRSISAELSTVNSPYLTNVKYFDKELFVDTSQSGDTEFPVLLMDWVDGVTLDKYIRANIDNEYALGELAYQFSCMAQWLLGQPFAHGDLKPDNILVRDDGSLVLVDYDGMYVPAMSGQAARELGSPDYRHPDRTTADFDEHIDDFAIVTILLSLKAIAVDPSLLERYGAPDRLLLSRADYHDYSRCALIKEIYPSPDGELNRLVSLLTQAIYYPKALTLSPELLKIEPVIDISNLSTKVTDEDLANAWTDEYGVKYSHDRKRLLWASKDLETYTIRKGTLVICDSAFGYWGVWCRREKLKSIKIPSTVILIGREAFASCISLKSIELPPSVTSIGRFAFKDCTSLETIVIPESTYQDGSKMNNFNRDYKQILIGCDNLRQIISPFFNEKNPPFFEGLPDTIQSLKNNKNEEVYFIDDCGVIYTKDKKELLKFPFSTDKSFYSILFECEVINPSASDKYIVDFYEGWPLKSSQNKLRYLYVSPLIKEIPNAAFKGLTNLEFLILPYGLKTLCEYLKETKLSRIDLPPLLENVSKVSFPPTLSVVNGETVNCFGVGDYLYSNDGELLWISPKLKDFKLSSIFKRLKDSALFYSNIKTLELCDDVENLENVRFPKSLEVIRGSAKNYEAFGSYLISKEGVLLWTNPRLEKFYITERVRTIKAGAFRESSVKLIVIPEGVETIESGAFDICHNLESLYLPVSLRNVGRDAFCNDEFDDDNDYHMKYVISTIKKIFVPKGYKVKLKDLIIEGGGEESNIFEY